MTSKTLGKKIQQDRVGERIRKKERERERERERARQRERERESGEGICQMTLTSE